MEDPFAELDAALALQEQIDGGYDEPEVVFLANGDFHVCRRHACPHASVDQESKQCVCLLSGATWGGTLVTEHDPNWTGRSTSSGDPDALGGVPVGGWKSRRDGFSESAKAYDAAALITAEAVSCAETEEEKALRLAKIAAKRGARCVDEAPEEQVVKKPKVVRKNLEGREVAEKLCAEAGAVLDKLTQPVCETQSAKEAAKSTIDPRLTDLGFVTKVALRKWAKRVAAGEDRADQSRLHDVLLGANEFARAKRKEILEAASISTLTGKKRREAFDGVLKSQFSLLIVSLWRACASTPYLEVSRRGGDSFRPFVSGVAYSLKRGVTCSLLNDEQIVPRLPRLAESLPTLRSADASQQARQLQSQSHRGICALSRSISSVEDLIEEGIDPDRVRECVNEFRTAAQVCQQFISYVAAREAAEA